MALPFRFYKNYRDIYNQKLISSKEAAQLVKSNSIIFCPGGMQDPREIFKEVEARKDELENVSLNMPNALFSFGEPFVITGWYVGAGIRKLVQTAKATYQPTQSSTGNKARAVKGIDMAFISVTPPDDHGYMNFGCMYTTQRSIAEMAKVVIAVVNENQPWTCSDVLIHISEVDYVVESHTKLLEVPPIPIDDVSRAIASYIVPEVEDGSTVQIGIGGIPNALMEALGDKHDLGVHSEMISEGMIDLAEGGVITGAKKSMHKYQMVGNFMGGTQRLYNWARNNPLIYMNLIGYTNNPFIISRQHKLVCINATMSVDFTGQANSESIGPVQYSGPGGQADFGIGCNLSSSP